jgi:hypothetical protein
MKSRLNFSGNSLNIKTPIKVFLFLELSGIILFTAGIYNLNAITFLDHFLIGTGIILISLGLFYVINSRYYKILVNEEPGFLSFVESNSWDISAFKIPTDYFSGILIQRIVNRKNRIEYDVLLKNRSGSFLMMARFPDRERGVMFGKKLEELLNMKAEINDASIPPHFHKNMDFAQVDLALPPGSSIKITERPYSTGISWRTTHHPLQFVFVIAMYYGFFHIITFSAISLVNSFIPAIIIIYSSMGLILSLLLAWIISSITARHFFIIYRGRIRSYKKSFGKKKNETFILKEDIVITRNSMDLSNETFAVGSKAWADAANKIMAAKENSEDSRIGIPGGSMLRADTSRLKLKEKLFIEQHILSNL